MNRPPSNDPVPIRKTRSFASLALVLAMGILVGLIGPIDHATAWGQNVEGSNAVNPTGTLPESLDLIPLTHLSVTGLISGSIAEVEVLQTYENRFDQRIEAVYVFPLPNEAAVNEMIMVIGERRIRADLREREAARRAYETARDQGQVASLLEQERPNIFTMNVANIEPGQPIQVLVRYVMQVPYKDGRYRYHHPTVVGPRFIPGTPTGQSGTGMLPDTHEVPDASRITPAVLPEGVRTPYEVDFELRLEAGMPIRDFESTSHDLTLNWANPSEVRITLPEQERQPNRDIEFSYALTGDAPEVGLLTHQDPEHGGFFTLMVEPPLRFDAEDVRPKEMVFVLDSSGSMSGYPIETSKAVMRYALEHMNPRDTFQIVRFDDAASGLSQHPLANTPENVRRGLAFIDSLTGQGGTAMNAGIRAALAPPADPERMRIVFFLTDGYIGNESEILALIDELVGESRLFSLGVGSSVNRFLLDSMAQVGRGAVQYVQNGEDVTGVVDTFYGRIKNPILTDITVDWGGLPVTEIIPDPIPDVFEGVPLLLTGRFSETAQGTVTIQGMQGARPIEFRIDVDLSTASASRPALPYIWARRRVEALESLVFYNRDEATRRQIIELALDFRLLTQYTSFVAIEETISADASDPLRTVGVPVALPAGVSDDFIGPQVVGLPQDTGIQATQGRATRARLGVTAAADFGAAPAGYFMPPPSAPVLAEPDEDEENRPTPVVETESTGETAEETTGETEPEPTTPEPTAGEPREATGALAGALNLHRMIFRACYVGLLADQPELQGQVRLAFTFGEDGAIGAVRVLTNTTGSDALGNCLAEAMAHLRLDSDVAEPGEYAFTLTFPL